MAELSISPDVIRDALKDFVAAYEPTGASATEVGTVIDAADGIAHVEGLPGVMANELVMFADGRPLVMLLTVKNESLMYRRSSAWIAPGARVLSRSFSFPTVARPAVRRCFRFRAKPRCVVPTARAPPSSGGGWNISPAKMASRSRVSGRRRSTRSFQPAR